MTGKKNGSAGSMQFDIRILGREYKVACGEDERADLLEAVTFVDRQMREIRDGSKSAGIERVAVMAALNIANDLLRERKAMARPTAPRAPDAESVDDKIVQRRIQAMHAAIDQALAGQEKLF